MSAGRPAPQAQNRTGAMCFLRARRRPESYDAGPTTVTNVPIGDKGHTLAASEIRISTHPLLWGEP